MAGAESIIDDVIRREGGYVNHPSDKGGPTKFGITQATLSQWRRKPVTAHDVEIMSEAEARQIYRANYVQAPHFDAIGDPDVQALVVDCAVLHGAGRAARWLQEALGVPADGAIGARTVAAMAAAHWADIRKGINARRLMFLADLVAGKPDQLVFLRGWIRRAVEFL